MQSPNSEALALLQTLGVNIALQDAVQHRGITCNECQMSPLKGSRYKCANCADFDLCEGCEQRTSHNQSHVFVKIRVPIPPLMNPRTSLLRPFYPGFKGENVLDEVVGSRFDSLELDALKRQFLSLSEYRDGQQRISRQIFMNCLGPLGTQKNLLCDRLFQFFAQGQSDLTFSRFVGGLDVLLKGTEIEKIRHAFRGYTSEEFITKSDLQQMYMAYFSISNELVRDVVRGIEEEVVEQFQHGGFDGGGNAPVSAAFTATIPQHQVDNNEVALSLDVSVKSRINNSVVLEALSQDAIKELVDSTIKNIRMRNQSTAKDDRVSFDEFKEFVQHDKSLLSWIDMLGTVF